MKNNEGIKIIGKATIELFGPDGKLKKYLEIKNMVINIGLYHIADQMSDQSQEQMSHAAIGTGTTTADPDDTALQTESARVALTSLSKGSDADANKVTYVADWAVGVGTGPITEAGIFNAADGGIMLSHIVFGVFAKEANDAMRIIWRHEYNRA